MRYLIAITLMSIAAGGPAAQAPVEGEVRQVVTFSFLSGKSAEAIARFRDHAVPLYEEDDAMIAFRGFREVESPIPLDLIVVSSFDGLAGMDASNATLGILAAEAGTSIGEIYGGIGALSSAHTDQFVEMLPALGTDDPAARRLTAFVWYRIRPGQTRAFEAALENDLVPWEVSSGIPSATGRFLLSDGWSYLRFVGFDTLGDYQAYWARLGEEAGYARIHELTDERREVIVARVPELSVR